MKPGIVLATILQVLMSVTTIVNGQSIIATSAGANIVDNGLSISQNRSMGISDIQVPSSPAEVMINASAETSLPVGNIGGDGKEIAVGNSACFTVKGKPGAVYTISIPTDITITHSNGLDQIAVAAFTASSSSSESSQRGIVNADGIDQFSVGATLKVETGQRSGYYSGTFGISVNYN